MSERPSGVPESAVADGLDDHLAAFLKSLAAAGYADNTRHDKRRLIAPFIRWARDRRLAAADLGESRVTSFLARPSRRRCKHGDPERAALHQFLDHLRGVGAAPPRRAPEPSAAAALLGRYLDYLRDRRGLSVRSIEVYAPFVRAFVAPRVIASSSVRFDALDSAAVRAYLLDRAHSRSISYVKLLTAALRSFLRFLFLEAETATDLSTAVPPVRRWRFATVPPFLLPDQVERVIASTDRSTARGRRDLAMLLLLARLGLRASEVVSLELDDIRWDIGEIVVRGKGRLHDRMPLLEDVGEALSLYVRHARGRSASRRVFLRLCAPRVGLSGPTAVCVAARAALRRAGLQPSGRVGSHVFRHSLATRMIRHGASLGEIAQVLRHRRLDTTQLYAKVEFESLRGVALPWPNAKARR
jgi:site-specific recombinase XerD